MKRISLGSAALLCTLLTAVAQADVQGTPSAATSETVQQQASTAKTHDIDALVDAALVGDIPKLTSFVEAGADLNLEDSHQTSALMAAVNSGKVEVVKFLLDKGVAVNAKRTNDGWTPLMLATFFGFDKVVNLLLDAGADVNLKNNYGETALIHASFRGQDDVARILIAHGADLSPKNDKGYDALKAAELKRYTNISRAIRAELDKQAAKKKTNDDKS